MIMINKINGYNNKIEVILIMMTYITILGGSIF